MESVPAGTPREHIPYRIVSKEERETLLPGGHFEPVWTFYIEGPHGEHFSVKVPARELDPATLDGMIEDQLAQLAEIHDLGDQPHPDNLAPEYSGAAPSA